MDKVNLDDSLRAAFVELQEYLELQLKYNKLLLGKKMGELFSYLALFVLVIGISGFLLLFLSLAFAEWFNEFYQRPYAGHLIVAAFYLFLALILIVFRKSLIFNPMRKGLGRVLFAEDEDSMGYEEAFMSNEKLNVKIRKYKKTLKKKEEKISETFQKLSEEFTIFNILQTIARNAYISFVTTSNIAKAGYSLIRKISRGRKKRKPQRKKGRRPELE
jgi:hypothetical protein